MGRVGGWGTALPSHFSPQPQRVLSQGIGPSSHWVTAATFKTAKDNMSQTASHVVYSPLHPGHYQMARYINTQ